MDLVTVVAFVILISGSLAYTEWRFRVALERVGRGHVSATAAPETETEKAAATLATTRLTTSQKRALLEAAAAQRVRDRMAK